MASIGVWRVEDCPLLLILGNEGVENKHLEVYVWAREAWIKCQLRCSLRILEAHECLVKLSDFADAREENENSLSRVGDASDELVDESIKVTLDLRHHLLSSLVPRLFLLGLLESTGRCSVREI
jgi:hypothetical protein